MKSVIENLGKVAPTLEGAFDNTKAYDRLSCVFDSKTGSTYISKRPVPVGIDIFDNKYWQPLSVGTNRIPLTENFGTDSFRSMTQKFLTELWNKQYKVNDSVADYAKRLAALETNLNGYAFAEMTEADYETAKGNNELEDNKVYFVIENQPSATTDDSK